jgi:hypothetical protein
VIVAAIGRHLQVIGRSVSFRLTTFYACPLSADHLMPFSLPRNLPIQGRPIYKSVVLNHPGRGRAPALLMLIDRVAELFFSLWIDVSGG